MELRGGGDIWRIFGEAFGHPDFPAGDTVCPSSPVSFDETTDNFTTASGRVYHIVSYQDKNNFVEQILKDVGNRGYEVH